MVRMNGSYKKWNISVLVLMLILALTGFVVAGCSSGASEEGSKNESQVSEEKPEGAAEEKAEGAAEGEAATEAEGEGEEHEAPNAKQREAQLEDTKEVKNGRVLFVDTCGPCHGADGSGVVGPKLKGTTLSYEAIKVKIEKGVASMPAFKGGELSDEQIDIISNYVVESMK